jgi:hypothetical protein
MGTAVGGMIYSSARRFGLIASRLWPAMPWRYEAGRRDLRLDLLRGFAVIAMITDHIGGERSWLYAITGGDAFFVSAAEVFVFISGLLMGIIYAGVIARQGLGTALRKSLQRIWTLYLLTVTLTLTFIALSTQLHLGWGTQATYATWPDLIMSVLTLHRTFYLTDILLLYTFLVLAAVPVLVLLARGYAPFVLVGSWGLWTLWQLAPQHVQLPWYIVDNSVFNFPAWQVLFVTAMIIGFHRQGLERCLTRVPGHVVLGISGGFVATALYLYVVFLMPLSIPPTGLVDQLFGKVDLRIGRLFVFASFFTFAFALITLVWTPVRRVCGWLLLPFGQDALSAYILHLFVVALAVKVKPVVLGATHATPTQNTLFQIAGIAFIWMAIIVRPTVLKWLRIWLEKATALLAAGRAYLDIPGASQQRDMIREARRAQHLTPRGSQG